MDVKLLSTRSRVNSLLQIDKDFYNIYRIDLTSGTLRVSTLPAETQTNYELVSVDDLDKFGITTDGVMCEIKVVESGKEVRKWITRLLKQEPKLYTPQNFVTTDGYYPAVAVGENAGYGIKKDEYDAWMGYSLIPKKAGYNPLVTEQCYFSDAWRLLMPCRPLLKHILEHFGWLADPYDWQEFPIESRAKKWVEFPPFKK